MAITTYDNAPYLYRRSGGGGDKEIDKLVGGTIAWNQLFKAEAGGVNANVGTKTYDSTTNTFTVTNSTSASWLGVYTLRANVLSTPNHKYLIFVKATNTLATNLMFGTDTSYKVQSGFTANTEKACSAVISPTNSASFIFYFNNASSVQFRDIQIFDLTLMFGSTIADYVYSLEQSSQGSGLAWLRSYGFFTEDYYDYNSGELKSVSNLVSHDMTGEDASTTLHSYPLGDVTLRGLPKLNGNALYYDGDTYESNGTVTRRYIVLTVNGSESWGKEADGWMSAQGVNSFYLSLAIQPNYIAGTITANATSNRLLVATYRDFRSDIAQPNWFTFTGGGAYIDISSTLSTVDEFKAWLQSNPVTVVYELATPTTETAEAYTNPQWVDPNGTERYTLSSNAFPMPVGHETTYNTDMGSKTVNTQVNLSMTEPQVRQIYAKEGDTARVLNIHLDQTEEDGTLRILRPDGTEVTADAVLVPEFYDGLMAEIPSDATSVVGKCYCDVEQNGVSSMPFTLNVKKNERAT